MARLPGAAMKDDVMLDVSDVKLSLGGTLILDGVSFQIVDRVREGVVTGQVVSLLGPSGVGKTRLLRIIAGLDDLAGAAPKCGHSLDQSWLPGLDRAVES